MANRFHLLLCLGLILRIAVPTYAQIKLSSSGSQQLQVFDIQSLINSGKYTPSQLEQLARMNGLSEAQIRNALGSQNNNSSGQGFKQIDANSNQSTRMLGRTSMDTDEKSVIFGLDFFQQQQGLQQPTENLPTPDHYILGTGDVLSIVVFGTSQQTYDLTISKEGQVMIPLVGPVQLQGLPVAAARTKLKRSLRSIYAGLSGANPSVFLEVNLKNLKSIQVQLVGEVLRPGSYLISSFASVLNLLIQGGGPTENGTFRNIRVYRNGQQVALFDAYEVLLFGNAGQDIQLVNGDIVVVGTYETRVAIKGEVRRPAQYELATSDRIQDLMAFGGGFTKDAFKDKVAVQRKGGINQKAFEVSISDKNFVFKDGDELTVWTDRDIQIEQVQVVGSIQRPGPYAWEEGMTLEQFLESAGGLLPDAAINGITIYSQGEDLRPTILNQASDSINWMKKTLMPGDLVSVPSQFELDEYEYVQIEGDVYATGLFPFFSGQSLTDAFILAGGVKNNAYGGRIEVARLKDGTSDYQLLTYPIPTNQEAMTSGSLNEVILQPFDQVMVRSIANRGQSIKIQLEGEIKLPGDYVITNKQTKISAIIQRAGGFTADAYPEGATLYRRNENFQPKDSQEDRLNRLLELRNNIKVSDALNQSLNPRVVEALENQISSLSQQIYNRKQSELEERNRKLVNALDTAIINQSLSSRFKIGKISKTPIDITFEKDQQSKLTNVSSSYDKVGIKLADIMRNPGGTEDIIVLPGDRIFVPRLEQTVRIRGAILHPTTVKYSGTKNFKSYISQAGGFSLQAKPGRSYVIHPNGEAERTKRFLFFRVWPEVKPGTEIVVSDGRIRTQFSFERILALTTNTVTTFLLVNSLRN